jgi:hypothetical protein
MNIKNIVKYQEDKQKLYDESCKAESDKILRTEILKNCNDFNMKKLKEMISKYMK